MSRTSNSAALLDLPLDVLTAVCLQLDLRDLIRFAVACKRLRHGDGGQEPVQLPTKSPVVMALLEQAFRRPELVPSTRPVGCCESWVAHPARCVRQHWCQEALPVAAGWGHSLFVASAGLKACSHGDAVGHPNKNGAFSYPAPVPGLVGLPVWSMAAGICYSLVLGCNGRVYSWGLNQKGQLGHGDKVGE
jgi:hypothetical protein